jgi:dTDP-4-dehydrorhamnose reductase
MGKILITGANGLLGSSLVPYLQQCGYDVVTHAYTSQADVKFNLSDSVFSFNIIEQLQPSIIINLVGLTSVELCEDQVNLAYLTNTRTVENLANWIRASRRQCHLIHISSDHLYDGTGPHNELEVTITNNYALSKFAGELAAIQVPSTILRTNFVGRSKSKNRESLTDWVYNSILSNTQVQVLQDVYFSPLSIALLVQMLELVVRKRPIGVYNLGSHKGMSKADFDFLFAECLNLPTKNMRRINSTDATFLKAYRPKDMRMDVSKFEDTLMIKLPSLPNLIEQIAKEYYEAA